jgi:hypothetical protein
MMKTQSARRGVTYVETLFVVAMIAVLAVIGIPQYLRAQTNALQSEAVTNLKSLATSLLTQQSPPFNIHVYGFDPPRGNRYSYHLDNGCWSFEDRSSLYAVQNNSDICVGVDVFQHMFFPMTFYPVSLTTYSWTRQTDWGTVPSALGSSAGIIGACGDPDWEFLAYAAGDVDDNAFDSADTWVVASADGDLSPVCPSSGSTQVPAGEPFMVNDDSVCN